MLTTRKKTICVSIAAALLAGVAATHAEAEGLFGPSRSVPPTVPPTQVDIDNLAPPDLEALLNEGGVLSEEGDRSSSSFEEFEIGDTEPIPSPQMIAVENARTGKMGFISANGRFYIEGTIVDLWNGQHLETVTDVRNSRQNIETNAIDYEEIATFSLGKGDSSVVIFTDPDCSSCFDVMRQAKDISDGNPDQYTFYIMQVPAGGAPSLPEVKKFWCASNPAQELLNASITGNTSELRINDECSIEKMGAAFVTADMIGVDAVPMVIAPDGYLTSEITPDLKTLLKNHRGNK